MSPLTFIRAQTICQASHQTLTDPPARSRQAPTKEPGGLQRRPSFGRLPLSQGIREVEKAPDQEADGKRYIRQTPKLRQTGDGPEEGQEKAESESEEEKDQVQPPSIGQRHGLRYEGTWPLDERDRLRSDCGG